MVITSAKYLKIADEAGNVTDNQAIVAVINGVTMTVPLSDQNYHYKEIMRQVDAGDLTIADAE